MARAPNCPPTPFGRFIAWRRQTALDGPGAKYPSHLQDLVAGKTRLSREDVVRIAECIMNSESPNMDHAGLNKAVIDRVEKEHTVPNRKNLYWILRGCLYSHEDSLLIMSEKAFTEGVMSTDGRNCHLISSRLQRFAMAQYGYLFDGVIPFREFDTTWVDVAEAGDDGFRAGELNLKVNARPKIIYPNDSIFRQLAEKRSRQWDEARERGEEAPVDNPTIAISSIAPSFDRSERRTLDVRFNRSTYRFNAVAKSVEGAPFRWKLLSQQIDAARIPVGLEYISSGIGVAVNVLCVRDGQSAIGQRLNVNFRRNEYDVGAVEGIRPTANVSPSGELDVRGVVRRALEEECGIDNAPDVLRRTTDDILRSTQIIGFGLDLEYYQYNFLCHCVLDITIEQLRKLWAFANDKRENKRFIGIEFSSACIEEFILSNHIWSSGIACLLKSSAMGRRC